MSRRFLRGTIGCFITASAFAQISPDGLWEFENSGDLTAATTGADLTANGSGFTAISGVDGSDGAVTVAIGSYYEMTHGLAANGGGSMVNNYTLLIDFRVPSIAEWACFYQTDTANTTDGEIFVQENTGRIGVGDLNYSTTTIAPNTWYRLLLTYTISGGLLNYRSYLNGSLIHDASVPAGGFTDGRFSLDNTVLLFADNNGEDNPIDVSTVAIYDGALTGADAMELGAAAEATTISGAGPIPAVPPGSPVSGPLGVALLAGSLAACGTLAVRRTRR